MEWIDLSWLGRNPVPASPVGADKNGRGRVLVVGGSAFVPGALILAGEAALRAGAGKLQLATVEKSAMHLGVAVPEAALFALPADANGEIAAEAADVIAAAAAKCDAIVMGPGMLDEEKCTRLMRRLFDRERAPLTLVLDAACIGTIAALQTIVAKHGDQLVLTPHCGEMARLLDVDEGDIKADLAIYAQKAAQALGVTIVLKSDQTVVASPDGLVCAYASDCPGLATSGSGDVLAGVIGGLLARGASPHVASSWAVWLHGEAGRILTGRSGTAGFLARELAREIPALADMSQLPPCDETAGLHKRTA